MARTIVDPRFRGRLANLLMACGTSQNLIARQANVSPSYLSQLVNGQRNPSIDVARALDETLNAGGQLANLVALAARPDDLDQLAAAAGNPRHISDATITSLERVLVGQRYLDDHMGSAALLGPVMAQMDTINTMVVEAAGPTRQPLLYVAAQWAQFAGWLHTSIGRYDKAADWFSRALQWAMQHGDRDLIATVLSYQGHVAWLSVQWQPALGFAEAALRDPAVYPGQRAYDAYASARAHAAIGEIREAERALELGNHLAEATETWAGEIPPWQYYRAPWFWSLERGLVALFIARHQPWSAQTAVTQLPAGLDGMPEEMRGADWAAEYMTHLAAAHMYADELDAARVVLGRARQAAEAVSSPRVLRLVEGRERRLRFAGATP